MRFESSDYAIYGDSSYGPTFGGGHDICIDSDSNTTNGSFSNLGHNYTHPQYAYKSNEAESFLAGSNQFQIEKIEVYAKL